MRAPAFWWKPSPDIVAHLLSPAGAIYGAVAANRMARSGERVGTPVICVGNFVAGGAGKTPTAIAIARELAARGHKPFFLSRGYGGTATGAPVRVDPASHNAADVGDEPLLLARTAPVIVSADRLAGARAAASQGASVIVMDDGLQNPSLAKDVRIAVVDGAVGAGNGLCIPAGPLRAPIERQFEHVDAIVVIGAGEPGERLAAQARARGKTAVQAHLEPDAATLERLRDHRIVAFAGIGRPEKFFDTLRGAGATLVATHGFADHRPYSEADLAKLHAEAYRAGALLVTTEKDHARIGAADDIVALPVTLQLDGGGTFAELAQDAFAKAGL
jgi:tetraacyldisaccharide 4'-kinase